MMIALVALTGPSAWAAGGSPGGPSAGVVVGAHAAAPTGANATGTTANTGTTSSAAGNPMSTNASPLPPPPPTSVNPTTSSQNTVPPTPAPATAGLPSPGTAGALPSTQGLPASTANELRPSPSLNTAQVADVQATLAAGGLYRGPIDGNMTASLRASIRQFQQISALPETGNLDAETMARLTRSNATSGSSGSNGNTSTSGNLSASQPFSTTIVPNVPATTTPPPGTATFSSPFQLSAPINTSPAAPPGVMIQP